MRSGASRRALLQGAGAALAVAVPAALIGQALTSADVIDGDSAVLLVFFLLVVAGFGLGGWVAARLSAHSPLRDGTAAAVLAYAVVQVIGVARLLLAGDDVDWVKVAFNAVLAASLGFMGAMIATRSTPAVATERDAAAGPQARSGRR